ncbi:MAG: FAD-dependent oxidoreductase [Ramlibacter sp.]|nr:FAD-dependent oxidoreductase [Ramlibacter sp.]
MTSELLVAGGGIGGLAAALAARRAGWEARVLEQADAFSEVGAGIQLGPNATRILGEWGVLQGALREQAAVPPVLRVRDALDGRELGQLELGDAFAERYGAPYLTMHRADLQAGLLLTAGEAGARLRSATRVDRVEQADFFGVRAHTSDRKSVEGDALVVADGVWSRLREAVVQDGPARPTGHLAYRAVASQRDLPPGLRSQEVTVWLAPRMHLVTYPVRGGEALNAVCIVQGTHPGDPQDWDHAATQKQLGSAVGRACATVRDRIAGMPTWRLWVLHDRPPVASAAALSQGRIALLGDAAHPMRPYLAQGAAMAIEDARELQRVLAVTDGRVIDVPLALRRYALNRWERVAKVQEQSRRNGTIFHAGGALRWGRNLALRALGERLLDQRWLYS